MIFVSYGDRDAGVEVSFGVGASRGGRRSVSRQGLWMVVVELVYRRRATRRNATHFACCYTTGTGRLVRDCAMYILLFFVVRTGPNCLPNAGVPWRGAGGREGIGGVCVL